MSELIVAGFRGEFTADEVLLDLLKMKQIHLIDLDYAVVVARRDDGSIRARHNNVLVHADAAAGGQWGTLFAGPVGFIIGGVIGAVIGETVYELKRIGIEDDFIKEVAQVIEPGSSAIFIRVRKSLSDKVVEELRNFNAKLLRAALTITSEAELMRELGQTMPGEKG
ncbi:MAG TPA: DUF1269 domain-containing protein [Geobacteraceae bacterium]